MDPSTAQNQTGALATFGENARVNKDEITPAVVGALIAEQFPQWRVLPVERVPLDGWDNTTFRLGSDLSVRLPSAEAYSAQVAKEHKWLPVLARQLPLAIPKPVALGVPGCGFPRPWSVYRWLPGEPAVVERVADLDEFAIAVGDFLAALYRIDTAGGPPAGRHCFFRGGPLTVYDGETRAAIDALGEEIDGAAATGAWDAALAAKWNGPACWFHGDVAASNLLVVDGRPAAVLDFGCSGIGDPACDLTIAWTLFAGTSRAAFRSRLDLDNGTWARGRGWALWKALIVHAGFVAGGRRGIDDGERRAGWRGGARHVIDEVLAEHAREGS
jgi:aminoglycoside phosphotransferase (APT) family kinase protein